MSHSNFLQTEVKLALTSTLSKSPLNNGMYAAMGRIIQLTSYGVLSKWTIQIQQNLAQF